MAVSQYRCAAGWLVLVALLPGCGFHKAKQSAEKFAQQQLALLKAGKCKEAYERTGPDYQEEVPQAKFEDQWTRLCDALGAMGQHKLIAWRVNRTPGGPVCRLVYEIQFTKGKARIEYILKESGTNTIVLSRSIASSVPWQKTEAQAKCAACGKLIPGDSAFCKLCGAKQKAKAPAETGSQGRVGKNESTKQ